MSRPGRSVEDVNADLHELAAQALAAPVDYTALYRFEVHVGIPQRPRIVALMRETGAPEPGGFGRGTWTLASCIIGNELPVPVSQAVIAACVLADARVAVQFNRERGLTGYLRLYIGSLASNAPKQPTPPHTLRRLLQPGVSPEAFYSLVDTVVPV